MFADQGTDGTIIIMGETGTSQKALEVNDDHEEQEWRILRNETFINI